ESATAKVDRDGAGNVHQAGLDVGGPGREAGGIADLGAHLGDAVRGGPLDPLAGERGRELGGQVVNLDERVQTGSGVDLELEQLDDARGAVGEGGGVVGLGEGERNLARQRREAGGDAVGAVS